VLTATFSNASSGHAYIMINKEDFLTTDSSLKIKSNITSNQSIVQQLIKEGKYRTLSRKLDPNGLYANTKCKWSLHC